MMTAATSGWEEKRSDETRMVESCLSRYFSQVDAYRYNGAVIRLRVIDPTFEGLDRTNRDAMVENHLAELPDETQNDIVTLFTFAPSELMNSPKTFREFMLNAEFEDPSPSML